MCCTVDHLTKLLMLYMVRTNSFRSALLYLKLHSSFVDQLLKLNNLLVDEKQKIKIIRLYGRTHERKDPVLEALHMDINENTEGMCADKYKQDALHFKIREEHIELKELEQKIRTAVQNDNIPSLATRKR